MPLHPTRIVDVRIESRGGSAPLDSPARSPVVEGPGLIEPVSLPIRRAHVATVLGNLVPGCAIEHAQSAGLVDADSPPLGDLGRSLFFHALAACFTNHHPFGLRPEVLGYLINHEIAITVKRHPEAYRSLFTRLASGKQEIEVRDDRLCPGQPSPWAEAIASFEAPLRLQVPDGIIDAMMPAYSTAGEAARVASLIAFMDAAQPFYDYTVHSYCGIPRIALFGTRDDWRRLLASAAKLAEQFDQHLATYFARVLPVLARIADQADPRVATDESFWVSIYKLDSASGGDRITGWSGNFVHYANSINGKGAARTYANDDLLPVSILPTHISTVPFRWKLLTRQLDMQLAAGVLALDDIDGFLTPGLSFAVLHAPARDTIDIRAEWARMPPWHRRSEVPTALRPGCVRLVQLYRVPTEASDEPVLDEPVRRLTALLRQIGVQTAQPRAPLQSCAGCRALIDESPLEHGNFDLAAGDLHRLAWHRPIVSRETLERIASLQVGEVDPTEEETATPAEHRREDAKGLLDYVAQVLAVALAAPTEHRHRDAEAQIPSEHQRLGRELEAASGRRAMRDIAAKLAHLACRASQEIPTAQRLPQCIAPRGRE